MIIGEDAVKYMLKKEEGSILIVDLEIDPSVRENLLEETYKYLVQRVEIPGFRKGKAPRSILEKFLGNNFYSEAIKIAAKEAYKLILEKEKIKPYSYPNFELPSSWDENEKIKLSFSMEVVPEIKIGEYRGFNIEMKNIEVESDEINKIIEQLKLQHSKLKPVEDREIAEGDLVYVERKTKDGEKLDPLWVRINGEYNPEIEKELIGMKISERKIIETQFPQDYPNNKFAGKTVPLIWEIKRVWTYDLINEEDLAKKLGYENIDGVYEGVKNRLYSEKLNREKDRIFGEVLEEILKNSEIDPPQSMVFSVVEVSLKSMIEDLDKQGKTLEEYLKSIGKSEDEFIEHLKNNAKKKIKIDYILNYIAEKENIKVTENELEEVIEDIASSEGKDVKEVKRVLNRENFIDDLRRKILINKVREFLIKENIESEGGGSR